MVERVVRDVIPDAMWVGSLESVERLVALGKEIQIKSHAEVERAFKDTASLRKAEFIRRNYFAPEDDANAEWRAENKRQVQAAKDKVPLTLSVKLTAYGEEIRGSAEEVLPLVDAPEDVSSITIRLGVDGYLPYGVPEHSGFRVAMDKSGAAAVIFGQSREWIDTVKPQLSRELNRQRPWYAWTRRSFPAVTISSLPITLPLTIAGVAVVRSPSEYAWFGWVLYAAAVILGMLSTLWVWPKLIPMFELVPNGVKSRGGRVVGLLGGAAVWVLGSILVPLIFQAMSSNGDK